MVKRIKEGMEEQIKERGNEEKGVGMNTQRSAAKTAIPLARTLRRQLLWIGLVMTLGCLALVFSFVVNAIELTTDNLMRLEAEAIAQEVQAKPEIPLPNSKRLSAWRSWQDIPEVSRQYFDHKEVLLGEPVEAVKELENGEFEYLYLLHYQNDEFGSLYLLSHHSEQEIESTITQLLDSAIWQSVLLTLTILAVLFVVIAWLIRRTLEPLKLLSDWSKQLNQQPDQAIDINFPITELNEIAQQLRQGVDEVRAANDREQQFLKHASHELRTPLAVIQASLDTVNLQLSNSSSSNSSLPNSRLPNSQAPADSPARRPIQRALKASERMIQLSDTLLWLARESDKTIPKEAVDVKALCTQLVSDHQYLLRQKQLEIKPLITVESITIEAPLFSIVLANLVRNALQHSGDGEVTIQLDQHSLQISNPAQDECDNSEPGFGLGLQLVQRICQKTGWDFTFQHKDGQVQVTILLAS